jgi:glycosidase
MTTRGIPMIYSGDEIAMPGGSDPDNRRDFPGGWPDDPRDAFEASGRTPDQEAVFENVRTLARLRGELEPLRCGKLVNLLVGDQSYAYARVTGERSVIVIINNAADATSIEFDVRPLHLSNGITLTDRLGLGTPLEVREGKIAAALPARSANIYVSKNRAMDSLN